MKIIVISAAPRMEAGNTQMILTPFLVGAREAGAQVDIALLGHKKIKRCMGCFTCYARTPGRCIHDDDMPPLIERVRKADILVLATPLYIDGMTSLAKTFIDRLAVFLDPHFEKDGEGLRHPLRWNFPPGIFLISVCGYPGLHNFDPLLAHMRAISRNFHSDFTGALLRPAVFSCLLTKKYPDEVRAVMTAVRNAGIELVRDGRISEESCAAVATDICSNDELMATANAYWAKELERSGDQPA